VLALITTASREEIAQDRTYGAFMFASILLRFVRRHRKRAVVKIIGGYANRQVSPDSKGFNRRQRSKRKFHPSLHSFCFLSVGPAFLSTP